jgi:hypothetical protein
MQPSKRYCKLIEIMCIVLVARYGALYAFGIFSYLQASYVRISAQPYTSTSEQAISSHRLHKPSIIAAGSRLLHITFDDLLKPGPGPAHLPMIATTSPQRLDPGLYHSFLPILQISRVLCDYRLLVVSVAE